MHHTTMTAMTPLKDPMRERVTVFESSKHRSKKATRKEAILNKREVKKNETGKRYIKTQVDEKKNHSYLHISNAYGKLDMMARVSNPSRG